MSRVVQPAGTRGSLKWIQRAINEDWPDLQPKSLPAISWVSPLAADDYAEYRDARFLERVGLSRLASDLKDFWPQRGPQWDALGTLPDGGVVLVEAKAHLAEFKSPATQAGPASRQKISVALNKTRDSLASGATNDWSGTYYQYANRLAHLCWLRSMKVNAHLMFVSFIGDDDMAGPASSAHWEIAFQAADQALGLSPRHQLSDQIHHVYPRVRKR